MCNNGITSAPVLPAAGVSCLQSRKSEAMHMSCERCRHMAQPLRCKTAWICPSVSLAGEAEGVGGTLMHRKWNLPRGLPQLKLKLRVSP